MYLLQNYKLLPPMFYKRNENALTVRLDNITCISSNQENPTAINSRKMEKQTSYIQLKNYFSVKNYTVN